jgi:hypothetical protein
MRRLAILLLLVALPTFAKDKANSQCYNLQPLFSELKNKFGEEPIFIGSSEQRRKSITMMLVNQETGTYTVLRVTKETGCIMDTGADVKYRMPKSLESKML